jgi:hypothetical protein
MQHDKPNGGIEIGMEYRYSDPIGMPLAEARAAASEQGLDRLVELLNAIIYADPDQKILAVKFNGMDEDIRLGEVHTNEDLPVKIGVMLT